MNSGETPSLFHHARGELAQDALLAWLAEWADPSLSRLDPALQEAGLRWVRLVFGDPGLQPSAVKAWCQVGRGRDRPDVLIRVTDESGQQHAAVVEHKVHAYARESQLKRYRARGANLPNLQNVADGHFRLAFLKTGLLTECERRTMEGNSWAVLDRQDLLALLTTASGISKSAILLDFQRHLQRLDDQCNAWRRRSPVTFSGRASLEWRAMLDAVCAGLRELGHKPGHGLVNPPTGSFAAMWWGWHRIGDRELYLQAHAIEGRGARIGIRLSSPGQKVKLPSEERHYWHREVVRAAQEDGLPFAPVRRLGSGKTVAVAEDVSDWWVEYSAGGVDMPATIAKLDQLARWVSTLQPASDP